jgi:putative membrane protein
MKHLILAGIALSAFGILSCNDGSRDAETTTDSTTVTSQFENNDSSYADSGNHMNSMTNGTGNSTVSLDTASAQFVNKAGSGSMMEIQLGQQASQNATNPRVKSFGAMLVNDHSAASNELKTIAGGNTPTTMMPEHQKHIDELANKQGSAWDKAYMDMMIKDHKTDIALFKKATAEAGNESIKAFATKTLPTLQKHLDSAQAIRKNLK